MRPPLPIVAPTDLDLRRAGTKDIPPGAIIVDLKGKEEISTYACKSSVHGRQL